jgi:ribonucleoside-diphosphate reductase subunit M1
MSLNESGKEDISADAAEQKRLAQLQCSIDNQDACLMCSG